MLITITDADRSIALAKAEEVGQRYTELGFKICATAGSIRFFEAYGIRNEPILKEHEGRPNISDAIKNGEIQLVINTPAGKLSPHLLYQFSLFAVI